MTSDWARLVTKERRSAFVKAQVSMGIPFQIRALRKNLQWSQADLANAAGMLQPRISAIETAGRGALNIETLERIAAAFDVGLQVRFVPFSELIRQSEEFDPELFSIATFEEEVAARSASMSGAQVLQDAIEATHLDRHRRLDGQRESTFMQVFDMESIRESAERPSRMPPHSQIVENRIPERESAR